jgi:hypothetical protein
MDCRLRNRDGTAVLSNTQNEGKNGRQRTPLEEAVYRMAGFVPSSTRRVIWVSFTGT